jgi:hypothetical protein
MESNLPSIASEITTPTEGGLGVNRWAVPGTKECAQFDDFELRLLRLPQAEMKLVHRFTHDKDGKPNLYIRELHIPAGVMTTTKIHLTEHPFVISQGSISILTENGGETRHEAPFCGITKPLTRRIIMHHTATVLTTFHVVNTTDLEKIESEIILKHDEHVLAAGLMPDLSGGAEKKQEVLQ